MSQNQPSLSPATGAAPDLARLLQSISAPPQPQQHAAYNAGVQPPAQSYQGAFQNASLASLFTQAQAQAPPQPAAAPPVQTPAQVSPTGQPDMNEIMAQLAKYQR
jgi:hypothetical protein